MSSTTWKKNGCKRFSIMHGPTIFEITSCCGSSGGSAPAFVSSCLSGPRTWNHITVSISQGERKKQRQLVLGPETLDLLSETFQHITAPEFRPVFTLSSVQVWNIVKNPVKWSALLCTPYTAAYYHLSFFNT